MEKFNTEKIGKSLRKIARENNIKDVSAVMLVTNNMLLYNELLDKYYDGEDKYLYTIYQMSSSIFKQLQEFHLTPQKKDKKVKNETSKLESILLKVNKR